MIFMPGDRVSYVGEKLKELRGARNLHIVAGVAGSDTAMVVENGEDAFIVSRYNLAPYRPSPKDEKDEKKGPVVEKRRTKKYTSEDEE